MKRFFKILFLFLITNICVFAAELTLIPSESGKYSALSKAFRTGEFSFNDINMYIIYLIDLLSIVAVSVSFVFIIIGGASMIAAFGSPDKIKNARKTIKNAIIGLFISSLAWVIVEFILRLVTF